MPVISWILLLIITAVIAITLLCKYPAWDSKKKDSNGQPNKLRHKKWFYAWLIGLSTLGGLWALFLPLALNQKFDGPNADGNQLRLHLLYITGGVLALTTLGETHRKNNLEKHKNDQDHTRQVHAERRSRYTKAIEHLFNENISVRLGGVYALAGLADEWLTDEETLLTKKERHKEGQAIITTLCSYIRSSFNLASKAEVLTKDEAPGNYEGGDQQFIKDQAKLREEQELRLTILDAIKTRLNSSTIAPEDGNEKLIKGLWSNFDYNFANATFFYDIDLTEARFLGKASFTNAKFNNNSNFTNMFFKEKVDFTEAEFTAYTNFTNTIFNSATNFLNTRFINVADFSKSRFRNRASFSQAIFGGYAYFTNSVFGDEKVDGNTYFNGAQFRRGVSFNNSILTGKTYFDKALFNEINLQSTKIIGSIEFTESYISIEVDGTTAPTLAGFKKGSKNVFSIDPTSSAKLIETEEHRSPDGTITIIPMGCFVFDPNTLEIIPHTPVSNDCTENNYPIKEHSKDD